MEYSRTQGSTSRAQHGYTLVELMVVVVIVGILAAIAIPSFVSYLNKSKTSEAVSFLAAIKQRQASYFAEMGRYCNVSPDGQTDWNPSGTAGEEPLDWTTDDNWNQLGAAPDTPAVLFQYSSTAGAPGTTPANAGYSDDRGYTGANFWFVSSARGDLNGDGTFVTFESYSESSNLYVSSSRGWE